MSAALQTEDGGTVVWLGFTAVFIGVAGIVGGALARGSPRAAALILPLTGVLGFVAISFGWLLAGPTLIVGAVLAWFGRTRTETGPGTATG
ncbi:hypothetical protein [Halostreptopolyspora alba]|uniref:hypothetical protein n=1 Tax=Halostreptopolyspora alba TaxID=2487137 RepID=UPI0011CD97B7